MVHIVTKPEHKAYFSTCLYYSSLLPTRAFKTWGFYSLRFCMIGHEDRRHFCWSVRNDLWSQEAAIANINPIIDEDGVPVFRTRIIQVKKTLTHVSKKPIQNEVLRVCFNYLVPYLKVVQQYVCCHFPREIKLMSFFLLRAFYFLDCMCFLHSAFCFLLSRCNSSSCVLRRPRRACGRFYWPDMGF